MEPEHFDPMTDHEAEQMDAGLRKIAHHVAYYRNALLEEGMDADDSLSASSTLAVFLFGETIDFG
jgi:hypothetical protein